MNGPNESYLDARPLLGLVVGVTADRRWEEQAELLRRRGARIVHGPTVRTHALGSAPELTEAIQAMVDDPPDLVVLTTAIGLRGLLESADALGRGEELRDVLGSAELIARGPKAAGVAAGEGWTPTWQAPQATSDEVVEHLAGRGIAGRRVAAVLDGRARPVLAEQMRELGADVVAVPVYRWELPSDHEPAHRLIETLVDDGLDALTFTSSPGVLNLFELAREIDRADELRAALDDGVRIVSVGPVCSSTLGSCDVGVDIEPRRPRLGAMVHSFATSVAATRRPTRVGDVELLLDGGDAVIDGEVVPLGPRERSMLDLLAQRTGVVAKTDLRDLIWGPDTGLHTVEVTVGRLRDRLAAAVGNRLQVIAVPRRGYRLAAG